MALFALSRHLTLPVKPLAPAGRRRTLFLWGHFALQTGSISGGTDSSPARLRSARLKCSYAWSVPVDSISRRNRAASGSRQLTVRGQPGTAGNIRTPSRPVPGAGSGTRALVLSGGRQNAHLACALGHISDRRPRLSSSRATLSCFRMLRTLGNRAMQRPAAIPSCAPRKRRSALRRRVSRPVGRVLCTRLRGPTAIHLGLPLPAASCGLPASIGRAALKRSRRSTPLPVPLPLDLAPGGVYLAAQVTLGAGGLLHRRFTLTPGVAGGGLFSVALSRGSPRVGVTDHPALRSPDLPRHARKPGATRPPGQLTRRCCTGYAQQRAQAARGGQPGVDRQCRPPVASSYAAAQ